MRDILIIGPLPPPIGGVSIHIARLCGRLKRDGIAHRVLNESRTPAMGHAHLRRIGPATYLAALARAKLVHIHSSNHYVRLVHTLVARLVGARVIQTVHTPIFTPMTLRALRLAAKLSHETIAVSDAIAALLNQPSKVIPAFIAPMGPSQSLGEEFSGWLAEQRGMNRKIVAFNAFRAELVDEQDLYGIDTVLDAFEDDDLRRNFSLAICISTTQGAEAYHEGISARIAELNTDSIRVFLGGLPFFEVLRSSDMFVRPTRADGDAISIREALWLGVPTIASDIAKRPEGTIIVPVSDSAALAAALTRSDASPPALPAARDFSTPIVDLYRSLINADSEWRAA